MVNYWPTTYQHFNLSFDHWGDYTKHRHDTWNQTSRPGYNLVLQLQFSAEAVSQYKKLITPNCEYSDAWNPFHSYGHPATPYTMAWARLDFSFRTGELLIEEIQNDYLREVISIYKRMEKLAANKEEKAQEELKQHWVLRSGGGTFESYQKYYEFLKPFFKVWDESVLSAVIWLAKEELGIDKIYYHTFEGGKTMKRFESGYSLPPRSLYTKLPKRFGFELTDEAPEFLKGERYLKRIFKKNNKLNWFVMQL